MDLQDILFFTISFLIIGITYYFFFMKNQTPKQNIAKKEEKVAEKPQQANQQANQAPAQRVDNTRNNRQRVNLQRESDEEEEKNSDDENYDDEGNDDPNAVKTQRELAREAKKQEKRQQREAMQQYYEQREQRDNSKRSKYEERDRQRELEQLKKEEEEKRQEELQRIKEQEEFENWKKFMEVEESGQDKVSAEDEERYYRELNEKMTNYIKLRKVVVLEEMTGEFKMTTQEVIDRIKALEINKMINGIIDERGKYIYITPKELEVLFRNLILKYLNELFKYYLKMSYFENNKKSVKNYIQSKGRVSRSDLIAECNRLIKLDPSQQDKEQISKEENELLKEVNKQFEQIKSEQK